MLGTSLGPPVLARTPPVPGHPGTAHPNACTARARATGADTPPHPTPAPPLPGGCATQHAPAPPAPPQSTFRAISSASCLFSVALLYARPTSATKSLTVPQRNLQRGASGGWRGAQHNGRAWMPGSRAAGVTPPRTKGQYRGYLPGTSSASSRWWPDRGQPGLGQGGRSAPLGTCAMPGRGALAPPSPAPSLLRR